MKIRNVLLLIIILFLSNCSLTDSEYRQALWEYTDLRAIDPTDASDPAYDLIALYTQTDGNQEEIRLDLLKHAEVPNYDLYLAFDTQSGGTTNLPISGRSDIEWDLLIIIPALGRIQILDNDNQLISKAAIRIFRDTMQDTLAISSNRESLFPTDFPPAKSFGYDLQVFLTPTGSTHISDQIGPIRSDSLPPPPAQVLFAFWNSFPAYTPATALRRWSGAHTGPLGGSHGLSHLLSTSQAAGIPIVLLDLKTPASLSTLDQMGKLDSIEELEENGGVILPDIVPGDSASLIYSNSLFAKSLYQYQTEIVQQFGILPSLFSFSPSGSIPTESPSQIVFLKQTGTVMQLRAVTPLRWQDKIVISVSEMHSQAHNGQTTEEGLSLDAKRALIETALFANQRPGNSHPILLLGGTLPESTWGIPNLARPSFQYINNHPWIKPLNIHDLTSLSAEPPETNIILGEIQSPNFEFEAKIQELEQALLETPNNVINQAAWQAYMSLSAPVSPNHPNLPSLRSNYIPVVWSLIEASHWAEVPYEKSSCEIDPDRDGQKECLIATQETFALFEIEHGAISFAFMRLPRNPIGNRLYQVIAPSSQFITGLSDPLFWKLEAGDLSDPSVIPGAFAEITSSYRATLTKPNQVLFNDPKSGLQKTIEIDKNRIDVQYQQIGTNLIDKVLVTIALNPWIRFEPGWADAYQESSLENGWSWQVDANESIHVYASNDISVSHFNQSRNDLWRAENPNKDYPKGHFLAYPLALLEIPASEGMEIRIELTRTDIME